MSRGKSGRIVIDIETDLKNRLHAHVALEGRTLKEWFVERTLAYLKMRDATEPHVLPPARRSKAEGGSR